MSCRGPALTDVESWGCGKCFCDIMGGVATADTVAGVASISIDLVLPLRLCHAGEPDKHRYDDKGWNLCA